jgi:hypothetical protein
MGRISRKDLERLSAYLDGELSPEERLIVEARLASEPQLRSRLEQLRRIRELLRSLPPISVPPNVVSKTRLRVESESAKPAAAKLAQPLDIVEEEVPVLCEAVPVLCEGYINPPEGILSAEYLTSEHLTKENGTKAEQTPKSAQSVGSNYSALWREIAGRLLRPRTWFWPAVAVGVAVLISFLPMDIEQRTSPRQRSVALKADRSVTHQAEMATDEPATAGVLKGPPLAPASESANALGVNASQAPHPADRVTVPFAEGISRAAQVPEELTTEKGKGGEAPQGQAAESGSLREIGAPAPEASPREGLGTSLRRALSEHQEPYTRGRVELKASESEEIRAAPTPSYPEAVASVILEVSSDLLRDQKSHLLHLASRNGLEVLPSLEKERAQHPEMGGGALWGAPGLAPSIAADSFPPLQRQAVSGKVSDRIAADLLTQGDTEILRLTGGEEEIKRFVMELTGQTGPLRFRGVLVPEQLAKTPLGEWFLTTLPPAKPLPEEFGEAKEPYLAEQTRRTARAGARFNVAPILPPPGRIKLSPQAEKVRNGGSPLAPQKAEFVMGAEPERTPHHPPPHLSHYLIEIYLVPSSIAPTEAPQ